MKKMFIFISFILITFHIKPVIKIGHRGACGYEPENTLQSFKKAVQLDVDAIEFDVRLCKSKTLVVIHDAKINRTTNGNGKVKNLRLEDIKKSDIKKGNGQKIPTLQEALNIIGKEVKKRGKKVKVLIELKEFETAKPVVEVIEEFVQKKGWKYTDFVVISFNKKALFEVRSLNDNIMLGFNFYTDKDLKAFFKKHASDQASFKRTKRNVKFVGVYYPYIDSKLLDMLHKRGFLVIVYTVNKKKDIERLKKLGVDGIVSNYPDRI